MRAGRISKRKHEEETSIINVQWQVNRESRVHHSVGSPGLIPAKVLDKHSTSQLKSGMLVRQFDLELNQPPL